MHSMPSIKRPGTNKRMSPSRKSSAKEMVPSPFVPVNAQALKSVTFEWSRACPIYTIDGRSVWHKGGGKLPYRPVIGDLVLRPNTGKYFFSYRINTDNSRVGFCTASVYATDDDLERWEFGHSEQPDSDDSDSIAEETDIPTFLQTLGAVPPPPGKHWEAYMDLQTSKVYVDGQETQKFWRLFVASCGGVVSFVVDTDIGAVQMFMDGRYVGMMLDEKSGLRGKAVYPCVGISGYDMANRSIGKGYMGAFVEPQQPFTCLY